MPQRDDYFNCAGSVRRPCGGGRAAATMGRGPWGGWRRSKLWSVVRLGATNNNNIGYQYTVLSSSLVGYLISQLIFGSREITLRERSILPKVSAKL